MNESEIVPHDQVPEWAERQVSITDHSIVKDEEGTLRYQENTLITWLHDIYHIDMNNLWVAYRRKVFTRDEFMQFYRDIGYSLSGFEEVWGDALDEMVPDEEDEQGESEASTP